MAERASITRATLHKVEQGDAGVSMGIYATVLYVLGMLDRLSVVAAVAHDQVGMDLETERLPERIRYPKTSPGKGAAP